MNYEIVKNENSEVKIEITVDFKVFDKAVQSVYNKQKGSIAIPGFRKGKAPRSVIEKQYGQGVFYEDAVNEILPVEYNKAIEALSLKPVSKPDVDVTVLEPGKDLVFTAEIAVEPEFTLENYMGIEVEKLSAEVTDAMIDEEIEKVRDMNSRLISDETRVIEEGDTIIMDYKGFSGEEQFEGGTADDQEIVIGSGKFIPGFEEQLIGFKAGDETEVKVTFPEEYHAPDLAGKEAVFQVKINDVKYKELPDVDDEFAKDVSEFDTLEAYKQSLRAELEKSKKESTDIEQKDKIIEAVTKLIPVEIPNKMVESEIDGMLDEFDQQLSQQGLNLEQYIQFTGGDMNAFRDQVRGDALNRVKTALVIDKVMIQENIEISDEDIEAELKTIAEGQERDLEEVREIFKYDDYSYLKSNLRSRKTIDFLVENAKLV